MEFGDCNCREWEERQSSQPFCPLTVHPCSCFSLVNLSWNPESKGAGSGSPQRAREAEQWPEIVGSYKVIIWRYKGRKASPSDGCCCCLSPDEERRDKVIWGMCGQTTCKRQKQKWNLRAEEMAQKWGAFVVLLEVLRSVPSSYIGQLKNSCPFKKKKKKDSDTFWSPQVTACICVITCTHTHIHTHT